MSDEKKQQRADSRSAGNDHGVIADTDRRLGGGQHTDEIRVPESRFFESRNSSDGSVPSDRSTKNVGAG